MNSNVFLDLLRPLSTEVGPIDIETIEDVSVRLERAKKNQVVFYNLKDDAKSQEVFETRFPKDNDFLLIISQMPSKTTIKKNYLVIPKENFLKAQKIVCDKLFPMERSRFKLIGITGTNGKSTTAYLGMSVSTLLGHPALSVGTLGIDSINKKEGDTDNTTPSYLDLRKILYTYQKEYEAFFLEVSSHSLDQNRLFDLRLDGGIFTSFSQDHLDYHPSMEEYFKSKEKMAEEYFSKNAVLVIPQEEEFLRKKLPKAKLAKSLKDREVKNIPFIFQIPYNRRNLECALEINEIIWNTSNIVDIFKLKNPKGRFSSIPFKDSFIVIDYAHTPEALERVLSSIKNIYSDYTLSLVFGCGGDRDRTKRPIMGKIAGDFVEKGKIYLTSDNPRSENPQKIIDDIKEGIKNPNLIINLDRKQAIKEALKNIREKEIVLIAGKGHEDYQEIKGVRHPFSDFSVVEEFLSDKKNNI